jgi:hypothetical protein
VPIGFHTWVSDIAVRADPPFFLQEGLPLAEPDSVRRKSVDISIPQVRLCSVFDERR